MQLIRSSSSQVINQIVQAPYVTPEMFGVVGNGDDTLFIQLAINSGYPVVFGPRLYTVTLTNTITLAGGTFYYSLLMKSGMNLFGVYGQTVIQLKAGQSTNASPKYFDMFVTNTTLSNVAFSGIIFDINFPNNDIGALSLLDNNTAPIMVSGTGVGINGLNISDCGFINVPGNTVIGLGQSNSPGAMGTKARITRCYFYNVGQHTTDHSSIYGWSDDLVISKCNFDNPSMPTTTCVAAELHGSANKFVNNTVHNYTQGAWAGDNYTNTATDQLIQGNTFSLLSFLGVGISSITGQGIKNIRILDNGFYFDNSSIAALSSQPYKIMVMPIVTYGVDGITVEDNQADGSLCTSAAPLAGMYAYCGTAGQKLDNVKFVNNKLIKFTQGVVLQTTHTSGSLGSFEVHINNFSSFQSISGYATVGVFTDMATALPIDRIKVNNNIYSGSFNYGVLLQGNHTDIDVDGNYYNSVTHPYTEAAATDASVFNAAHLYGRETRLRSAIPSIANWIVGDTILNSAPSATNTPGWNCITAGQPGTWEALPFYLYGQMWYHNDSAPYTLALVTGTPAQIACFDTASDGQSLNGFSYSTSALTCLVAGTYKVSYSQTMGSSTSNHIYRTRIAINGVEQLSTASHTKPSNSTDERASSGCGIISLNVNDVITIQMTDTTAGNSTATIFSLNVNLDRVGN